MNNPNTLFFDINETLLDLSPLKLSVGQALNGKDDLLPLWFTTMLHYSLVDTLTENYRSFAEIGIASLMMIGERYGISISKDQAAEAIIVPFTSLPPHPDVKSSLESLSSSGYRLVSLTNSSSEASAKQLEFAGIIDCFDMRISTDEVSAFKPDPRVYQNALAKTNSDPQNSMMIAAHAWDLAGARKVGLQTAFIKRKGTSLYPNTEAPDIVVSGLSELTQLLSGK